MSFLGPPWRHDVFVSYSHGPSGSPNLARFSRALIEDLEDELRCFPRLGNALSVFFDRSEDQAESVDPMRHLEPQLAEGARDAGVLVVLMSDFYLMSPRWCPAEREWWFEGQAKRGLPTDGRIAAVKIWRLAGDARWPADLCAPDGEPLPGLTFVDPAGSAPQPWGWPKPEDSLSAREYRGQVLELANRVAGALERFRQHLDAERRRESHAARLGGDPVVYLYARPELAAAWQRLHDAFGAAGLAVVPGAAAPADAGATAYQRTRQLRIETMAGADALLLVGAPDAATIEADLMSIGRQDRHAAISRGDRDLPCALLDVDGVGARTPSVRALAERLGIAWLEAPGGDWPVVAGRWLAASAEAAATPPTAPAPALAGAGP